MFLSPGPAPTVSPLNCPPALPANRIIEELYGRLEERDAIDRATNGIEKLTTRVDQFGFALDASKSKQAQWADSLGKAFDPIEGALSAQEALADGQRNLADAEEDLADILAGRTEGVKSAARTLREAREDLNKAMADTGPGSEAAEDAADSLRDALRSLRDAQIEAGKDPREGDFFEDRRAQVMEAYDKVNDAQKKLAEIEAGNSDAVVAARDRIADAQVRYNEELSKTGPKSDEARAAQERVNDANDALLPLLVANEQAQATLVDTAQKHPEAIQASIDKVKEWQRQGLIGAAVADEWLKRLILIAEAGRQNADVGSEFVGDDGIDREHQGRRPVTGAGTKPQSNVPKEVISIEAGERIGLDERDPGFDGERQQLYHYDNDGRTWYLDRESGTWSRYATGGLVPGYGFGDTHRALLEPGEMVIRKSTVQKVGAGNLMALNSTATIPATMSPFGQQSTSGPDVVAAIEALHRDVVAALNVTTTPDLSSVAWLQAIEANTRADRSTRTPADVRAVGAALA